MLRIVAALGIVSLLVIGTATNTLAKKDNDEWGRDDDAPRHTNSIHVPEPSSVYAASSGLLVLGAAGWLLRRKR